MMALHEISVELFGILISPKKKRVGKEEQGEVRTEESTPQQKSLW